MTTRNTDRTAALVTGASGGIGLALSHELAQRGYDIILVARSAGALEELGRNLASRYGIRTQALALDLSRMDAGQILDAEVKKTGWTVSVLVNNAGFGAWGKFHEVEWETLRQMMQLNMATLTEITHRFLPDMLARGQGRILNVGSTASFGPVPLMAVYAATKAYVLSFSHALAEELSGTGVTVTALCPGVTATSFAQRAHAEKIMLAKIQSMTPEAVARIACRGMMKGQRQVVPGLFNRMLVFSMKWTPVKMLVRTGKRLMSK